MNVVQLIDSLEPGGAERMAVTLANSLANEIPLSGLVVTRKEGALKETISEKVNYMYLDRRKVVDWEALKKFKRYIKQYHITILHAHGSSFLFAVFTKLLTPEIKIIWHDHLGARIYSGENYTLLKKCSKFFAATLAVSNGLKQWAEENLKAPKKFVLPNFSENKLVKQTTYLFGEEGKRIVMVANLKKPKNHMMLIEAFHKSGIHNQGWSLHLIGRDFEDDYANVLKQYIQLYSLSAFVFIYGLCTDVPAILPQATIGALISDSEAFPVSLVEYGNHGLAVIATDVGENNLIISDTENGLLVSKGNVNQLSESLKQMVGDMKTTQIMAAKFHESVCRKYAKEAVLNNLIAIYEQA